MAEQSQEDSITLLCKALEVSESGYDGWRGRKASQHCREDAKLAAEIRQIFLDHRQVYGSPRIHAALKARGMPCSRQPVVRLMRASGLVGWTETFAQADHQKRSACSICPHHLTRECTAEQPHSKWVTHTTAVETAEGWLYLAVSLDLFSRLVVGWAMAGTEDGALVELALRMAYARRHPGAGLLHHADRGTEFPSDRSQAARRELGSEVRMSRTANCWDNAARQSFFATLTKACTDRTRFQSRQPARSAMFEYLECFYNPTRLHSTVHYVSPVAFEQATESRMS